MTSKTKIALAVALTLITDSQAKKNLTSIKTSGAKLDSLIHVTGLYAIDQANKHGRVTHMNVLINNIGKSGRKEALIVWLRDHAKVFMNKQGIFEFRSNRKLYNKDTGAEINADQALIQANDNPFYDYTKEAKPVSSYDVLTRLESLLKSAKGFVGEVKHAELLGTLQTVIDAAKAGQVLEVADDNQADGATLLDAMEKNQAQVAA